MTELRESKSWWKWEIVHDYGKQKVKGSQVYGFVVLPHPDGYVVIMESRKEDKRIWRTQHRIPISQIEEFIFALRLAAAGELGRQAMWAEHQSQKE